MRILICFIILYTFLSNSIFAQDTLPRLTVTNVSNNVIISWTNPYPALTTINIQRSFDSTRYFTTIGSILDVKNKKNGYVDSKPYSTKLFYRVFLAFEGGAYLFTKSYRPVRDTAKALPLPAKEVKQPTVITWFVPSTRVYSGKDNNVIISLPDADKKKYSLKFFEDSGSLAFEIHKITEPYLTLEKVNFSHAGIFNFELYEDGNLIERHKVYIARDGKPLTGAELDRIFR